MMELLERFWTSAAAEPLTKGLAGLILVWMAAYLLRRAISAGIENVDVRYRARKFVTLAGYLAAILVVVGTVSDGLGGLSVAFGVAGAGIAFALQEVIASVAGWIAISAGGFYSPGDRVKVGGITGDVIDISILRTTLMEVGEWVNGDLYNGRMVRIANSFVFKEPVTNYSGEFPFLWDEIRLAVHHSSDVARTRQILERTAAGHVTEYASQVKSSWKGIVKRYRIEAANVEPVITVELTPQWIEFTLRYVVDYRKRRSTKDQLFQQILNEIATSDGAIRMPTSAVELDGGATQNAQREPKKQLDS